MAHDGISRRALTLAIGATVAAISAGADARRKPPTADGPKPESESGQEDAHAGKTLQIGMLAYPGFEPLDLVSPHCILSGLANTHVHLVWKTSDPIVTEGGFSIVPTTSIDHCPRDLDVLFVPGGTWGTVAMMEDEEILSFLADRGSRARYVTSVCTGSLILGAAGLLQGYEASSHWMFRDILPVLGAKPVDKRVVQDRNRMTGGGVTSGIDFGLVLASILRGREVAEIRQLTNEYDPQPPFRAGSPATADPAIQSAVRERLNSAYRQMRLAADRAHKLGHLGSV